MNQTVRIKDANALALMRLAGQRAAAVLEYIGPFVQVGCSTNYLNDLVHHFIVDTLGDIPAPLNYRGFPKSVCTSVNDEICHGIPSERILQDGDIINIDVTVIHQGYHGDTSKMFLLGHCSDTAKKLCAASQACLYQGIDRARAGVSTGTIGACIAELACLHRFSVVREYCGHGIGKLFHEPELQILHYGIPNTGIVFKPGMTFTIEPMINSGKRHVKLLKDNWTVVTKDHSLSAQWEHTLAIHEDDIEVLTIRQEERDIANQHGWLVPEPYLAWKKPDA